MTTISTDSLAAVTLAELNAAASLLTRVDRKYLLPVHAAQDLVHALGDAQVLQIGRRRSFAYASTYFDTPDLDSYYLAARGRRRRFKVRTRSYLDSGLTFLEVKTRGGRHTTLKSRTEYDRTDLLTEPGRRFVAECLATSGACPQARADEVADTLMPALSTTYERTTLHLPEESARLTLDTRLAWIGLPPRGAPAVGRTGSAGRRRIPVRAAGALAIVETKTPAAPSAADRWLWAAGHRPAVISKYATGMALLHPELPANKWHHILTHELAAA